MAIQMSGPPRHLNPVKDDSDHAFLRVEGPITPVTGNLDPPPTLRHIPPSPETHSGLTRMPDTEAGHLYLSSTGSAARRRGSGDTATSHQSGESGPLHSDSDNGSHSLPGVLVGNSEEIVERRSSSRHRPSESKSGGLSAMGFFRRKRDRTASKGETEISISAPFFPPENFPPEGYALHEGTESSFDNSDRMSKEDAGRPSLSLGRTSLRRKASTSKSLAKTKQGLDRLALGIEHAFSAKQRSPHDRDTSDQEGGYNSADSRTPGTEAESSNYNGYEFPTTNGETARNGFSTMINQMHIVSPLPPVPQDIARRNSTHLLQEMSKTGAASGDTRRMAINVPSRDDETRNFVSPDVSPKLQSAGISSDHSHSHGGNTAREAAPAPVRQSTMPTSETFNTRISGPRLLSYGSPRKQSLPDTRVHIKTGASVLHATEKQLYQRERPVPMAISSDNEMSGPNGTRHSRTRPVDVAPSTLAPLHNDGLATVVPPERTSSRNKAEQLDGSVTLGRSRSRTLTVPKQSQIDSASDAAPSDWELSRHRRKSSEQGRKTESQTGLETDDPSASTSRRHLGSTHDTKNGNTSYQSGSDAPGFGTIATSHRSSKRLLVDPSRDKENRGDRSDIANGSANSRKDRNASEAVRKKRSSEGKPSRSGKEREREKEGRSTRREGKREKEFVFPSADVAISSRMTMYWSQMAQQGQAPDKALRAHTSTMVGNKMYVFGGCDRHGCWRGVATYNTDSHVWARLCSTGVTLPPLRAHTTTAVGHLLYVFGGGDGPTYHNDVWVYNTVESKWSKPNIITAKNSWPLQRRAHTTVQYKNYLVVFGGGNGQAALNDVWALNVSDPDELTWEEWRATGDVPLQKGYHTANLVGSKMIVYGGSDGTTSFSEVHILDLETMIWTQIETDVKFNRLSHTSTLVGLHLFIIGGHDGNHYAQNVLLFNLDTLSWETRTIAGKLPSGRGYHTTLLDDYRLIVFAGYNGVGHFDDLWSLDLAASAFLPQISGFKINETSKRVQH